MSLESDRVEYSLFIDDERDPKDVFWTNPLDLYQNGNWIIARNWTETIFIIETLGMPGHISFDHDLGEMCIFNGYDICKKLCDLDMNGEKNMKFPQKFSFGIHSQNPVGSKNIKAYMNNYLSFKGKG